jgi:hypothetical protein
MYNNLDQNADFLETWYITHVLSSAFQILMKVFNLLQEKEKNCILCLSNYCIIHGKNSGIKYWGISKAVSLWTTVGFRLGVVETDALEVYFLA